MIRVLQGDCRDVLPQLEAGSVHCVVTSPPYYGLRDYGTAQWDGGDDLLCDHKGTELASASSTLDGGKDKLRAIGMPFRDICGKCGARRIDRQLGLEATPDEYLQTMVGVFREVRRVLRPDGTCWVNMGSSYSTGKGSNVTEQLNRLLEGGSVFFTDAHADGIAGHGVGITLEHERTPDGELPGFLAAKWDSVEQRHQDLGQIADLFASPGCAGLRPAVGMGREVTQSSDSQVLLKECEHRSVILPELDAKPEPILVVLRPGGALASEDHEAPFAIDQSDEPSIGGNVRWHTAWHTFAREALCKGAKDVHVVDQAIALGNRPNTLAGLLCDFRVAKASEKQITLTGIHGGLTLAISDVGHLWFVLKCGSVVPYRSLFADASRSANALLPKQDLGMPWRLARALQEDGWILRSPIIWAKPNPMPESVTDRPTSAHEHVFLLTKSARYYYDADAVREEAQPSTLERDAYRRTGYAKEGEADQRVNYLDPAQGEFRQCNGRNLRNVWTIAAAPFSEWTPQIELVPVPASEALALVASKNAGGGDIARITSPDCPSHVGQSDRVPKGFYDGLSEAQLTSIRDTGAHRAQDTPSGSSTIQRTPDLSQSRPSTNDCSRPEGVGIATLRSSEGRRTGLDPLFSGRAISSGRIASDTPRTGSGLLRLASSDRGTDASRSGGDSSPLSCEPETAGGTARISELDGSCACRCGYYRKVTTKTSHFATFPPALVERCIKAGCPQWGTVLDPFAGAGTTMLVADRLQRHAIGIELNAGYAAMSRNRIYADAPLLAEVAD